MPNMNPGITPLQGRVMFHNERLCMSAGGNGRKIHDRFIERASAAGLRVAIDTYTDDECLVALQCLEQAARDCGAHRFRDIRCT